VSRQLRDSVVFASQNLISDPPFSRLDLISCRNLLIYLELDVQKKLISLFHFALHEGGYLLLGASETLGQRQDLFEMVSKKWRIFHRIGPARSNTMDFPQLEAEKHTEISLLARNGVPRMPELAQRILLDEYTPASVIINRKHDIVYFYGAVSRYLDLPMGEPTHNLLSMAREGMQPKLRALVHKAIREGQTMVGKTRIESGWVKIMVKPLTRPKEGLSLISFTDEPNMATALSEMAEAEKNDEEGLAKQLEYELQVTKEDLQSTIEELETANEELKASNEEVMSMNEELQSTNEELETSKEELQSLNEELNTINNQLQEKVEELELTNNDLANLLSSTDIATLFLDQGFHIKRFTPSATRLFNLIPSDVGRHITDITHQFSDEQLLTEAKTVLDSLIPLESEIQTKDGTWYVRRILPYRTQDNKIEGVVITFIDISELKQTESVLRDNEARLKQAEQIAHLGNWEWDLTGQNLDKCSDEIFHLLGLTPNTTQLTYPIFQQCIHPADREEVISTLEQSIKNGKSVDIDFRTQHPEGRVCCLHLWATVQYDDKQQPIKMLGIMQDITERKRIEDALRRNEARFKAIFDHAGVGIVLIDAQGRMLQANARWSEMTGYSAEELTQMTLADFSHPEEMPTIREHFDKFVVGDISSFQLDGTYIRKDGSIFVGQLLVTSVCDAGGVFQKDIGVLIDITQRKEAEAQLRKREEHYRKLFVNNKAVQLLVDCSDFRIVDANNAAAKYYGYSIKELKSKNFFSDISALSDEERSQEVLRAKAEKRDYFNFKHRLANGELRNVEVYRGELEIAERRLFHLIVQDVTQRKKAEMENKRLLSQQSKLAAMGEMLGAIAHQWRQPLHVLGLVIGGIKSAYQSGKLDSQSLNRAVELAKKQIEFMDKTTNNFKNFLAPDQKKVTFSAMAAIEDLIDLFGTLYADHHNINIHLEGDKAVKIRGYPNEFRQVILNILDNAKDAIKVQGKGYIQINVSVVEGQAKITIRDNGCGIPEDKLNRIFEAHCTTKSEQGGSGIGLYMSKTIIENTMNGKIFAENTGEGAMFTMLLEADF
jgi:PAS domain S-box-containing protein